MYRACELKDQTYKKTRMWHSMIFLGVLAECKVWESMPEQQCASADGMGQLPPTASRPLVVRVDFRVASVQNSAGSSHHVMRSCLAKSQGCENGVFGKRCFLSLPKTDGFDEKWRKCQFTFYHKNKELRSSGPGSRRK